MDQLPALFKRLEMERLERVQLALFEAAEAGVPVVARAAPVDMGETRRSVHAEHMGAGAARILVDSPVAGIVELGSRPHWAPLAPLIAWVNRHKASFANSTNLVGIAKAIQVKISKVGTRPTHFVRNSLPRLRKILDSVVKKAIKDPG